MKKVKAFWQKVVGGVKKAGSKVALMAAMPIMPITAEATDLSGSVESIKGMLTDFSVSNLIIIIGAAMASVVTLVLFWFAFRYIAYRVFNALKGKFSTK